MWKPKGVVLVASPWNFSCSIPVGGVSAALAAGNGVLFKPAPEAVQMGRLVAEVLWEGGISRNLLQFIVCDDEPVGSKIIQDERVNAVILTGATATARHFLHLRPNPELFAETGGKNAIIVTRMADRDLAVREVVQSAFGYSGQKCSACSLLICEAEVYDDPQFRRQLLDAASSLAVGSARDLKTRVGPLIRAPGEALLRGLTTLDADEEWLLKPVQDAQEPNLWSPGIKLHVKPGSFMHQTELFGPVLAVMRARDLEEAIAFANGTPYGLTSGLFSLDEREQQLWVSKIDAGNLYINRGITGAVVRRQPFGGVKESSFGPGAKAGGPNYLMQLMTPFGEYNGTSYTQAWEEEFSKRHDPSLLIGQDNFFFYRPREVWLRFQRQDRPSDIAQVCAAASLCGAKLTVSVDPEELARFEQPSMSGVTWVVEDEETFLSACGNGRRVRFVSAQPLQILSRLVSQGAHVSQCPVSGCGRVELLHYLHEVSLSIDYHRYGNLGVRENETRAPLNRG
jgi:RHH-type proline utilization regulon transcriptional repressor/proline dehydrogenase/delta 1-pyrroline-5-carboxylate dehydrogenase